MTGRAFLPTALGANALIAMEAAWAADLTDIDGSGWTWSDISQSVRHQQGTSATIGRTDNVGQAPAAKFACTLNNPDGDFTAGHANDVGVAQNTPIRQRISLDAGATWSTRFQGYLDSANPSANTRGKVRQVDLTALGMKGRLSGRKKPLRSALYRSLSQTAGMLAYWPFEDASGSTQAASAVAGVSAMTPLTGVNPPTFGDGGPAGSVTGANFANGRLATAAIPGATVGSCGAHMSLRLNDPTDDYVVFAQIKTSTGAVIQLVNFNFGGGVEGFEIGWVSQAHPAALTLGFSALSDGDDHLVTLAMTQVSADVNIDVYVDGAHHGPLTISSDTLGAVNAVALAPGTDVILGDPTHPPTSDFNLSHLQFFSPVTVPPDNLAGIADALDGYTGETASDRLIRLCEQEGIALDLFGSSNITMGPQQPDTILNLLQECESADHGLLYDGLGPGLGYQCRSERYNVPTALSLDMGASPRPEMGPTFTPFFDRQAVKNLYTVSRKGGSSATFEQTDGPLGTAAIGVEDSTATVNIDQDSMLIHHAGWLVNLGTVPGFRYPQIGLNMRGIPAKANTVLRLFTVLDNFGRTASSSWDNADTGQPWTTSGTASEFNVASGVGTHTLGSAGARHFSVIGSAADIRVKASFKTAAGVTPTGAGLAMSTVTRWSATTDYYEFRADVQTDLSIVATIVKRVANVGTNLVSVTVPDVTYSANTFHRIVGEVKGTQLRMKVWKGVVDQEPDEWLLTTFDTSLTAAGMYGVESIRDGGNTNTSPVISWDVFTAEIPADPIGYRMTIENPDAVDTAQPAGPVELIVEGWTETTAADKWTIVDNTSPFAPFRVFVLDVDELDDPLVRLAL